MKDKFKQISDYFKKYYDIMPIIRLSPREIGIIEIFIADEDKGVQKISFTENYLKKNSAIEIIKQIKEELK